MANDRSTGPDMLKLACAIIRRGDPEPVDWTSRRPDWIRLAGTIAVQGGTAEEALAALQQAKSQSIE
jgi:hypothetical protein